MKKLRKIEVDIRKLTKPGYFCYFLGPYEIVKGQTIYVGVGCNVVCKVDGEYFDLINEENKYSISPEHVGKKLELYVIDKKENNCNYAVTKSKDIEGYHGIFQFIVKYPKLFNSKFNYNTGQNDATGITVDVIQKLVNNGIKDEKFYKKLTNKKEDEIKIILKERMNELLDTYGLEVKGEVLIFPKYPVDNKIDYLNI